LGLVETVEKVVTRVIETEHTGGEKERRVLIYMITDDAFAAAVIPEWDAAWKDDGRLQKDGLFNSSYANQVGRIVLEYFRTHKQAPHKEMTYLFRDWAATKGSSANDRGEVEAAEGLLKTLNEEYKWGEDDSTPLSRKVETAEGHFNKVRREKVATGAKEADDRGRPDLAAALLTNHKPVKLGKTVERFPSLNRKELLDRASVPVPYLIEGVLSEGQPCILAGPYKCMKTSVMLDLAFSLISGLPFLDRFHVEKPVPVLVMSAESGTPTIARNHETISRTRSSFCRKPLREEWFRDWNSWENHEFVPLVPFFNSPADMLELEKKMIAVGAKVLFVDTASKAMDGENASNLIMMQAQLQIAADVCERLGATFVLLHHTRVIAGDQHRPLELSDIAYAGFKEFFRQWILLNRREVYSPPEGDEPRIHRLHLTVGGSAGHGGLYGLEINEGTNGRPRWGVKVEAGRATRDADASRKDDARLEKDKELVLRALRDGKARVMRELSESIGNMPRTKAAVDSVGEEGRIVPTEVKRENGRFYAGWRLTANTANDC
jgi:hypothetical protein